MIYEKEVFENPPSRYRIRPMTHVWPGHDREIFVRMLKDYGYGGVVTNVRQEDGFTANQMCIRDRISNAVFIYWGPQYEK